VKVFCSLTCAIIRAKPCYSVTPVICCWKHIIRGIWISFCLCLILFCEATYIVCVTYPWWNDNGFWQELHSSDRNHQHCQLLNISSSLKKIFVDSYVWMQKFITTAFQKVLKLLYFESQIGGTLQWIGPSFFFYFSFLSLCMYLFFSILL